MLIPHLDVGNHGAKLGLSSRLEKRVSKQHFPNFEPWFSGTKKERVLEWKKVYKKLHSVCW